MLLKNGKTGTHVLPDNGALKPSKHVSSNSPSRNSSRGNSDGSALSNLVPKMENEDVQICLCN